MTAVRTDPETAEAMDRAMEERETYPDFFDDVCTVVGKSLGTVTNAEEILSRLLLCRNLHNFLLEHYDVSRKES